MAVSDDVFELVSVLNASGFSVLAGEILMEIGLGEERLDEDVEAGNEADLDFLGQKQTTRIQIPEDRQLAVALEIVRLRLVEPMKRYAEAERIAGDILRSNKETGRLPVEDTEPVRIAFTPNDYGDERVISRGEIAGGYGEAASLEDEIHRLMRLQD